MLFPLVLAIYSLPRWVTSTFTVLVSLQDVTPDFLSYLYLGALGYVNEVVVPQLLIASAVLLFWPLFSGVWARLVSGEEHIRLKTDSFPWQYVSCACVWPLSD